MKHQDRNRIGLNHAGGPDNTHTGERPGGNRILLVGAWDLPLKMQYPQCCGRRQGAQGGHWFVALDLETIGTKITRITPSSPPPAPPTLSFCWAIETMLKAPQIRDERERERLISGLRGAPQRWGVGRWLTLFWTCTTGFEATPDAAVLAQKKRPNQRRVVERFRLVGGWALAHHPTLSPSGFQLLVTINSAKIKCKKNPKSKRGRSRWYQRAGETLTWVWSSLQTPPIPRWDPKTCNDSGWWEQFRRWLRERMEKREKP